MKPYLFIPFLAITTIAQEAEPAPTPTFGLPAYSREEITYAQGETADAAANAIRKAESEIKEPEPKRSFLDQENFLRLMSEKGYTPEKVDSIAEHLRSKDYYGSDKLRSTRL